MTQESCGDRLHTVKATCGNRLGIQCHIGRRYGTHFLEPRSRLCKAPLSSGDRLEKCWSGILSKRAMPPSAIAGLVPAHPTRKVSSFHWSRSGWRTICGHKWVWLDQWCMPQGEKTAEETTSFKIMLEHVHMLYLSKSCHLFHRFCVQVPRRWRKYAEEGEEGL